MTWIDLAQQLDLDRAGSRYTKIETYPGRRTVTHLMRILTAKAVSGEYYDEAVHYHVPSSFDLESRLRARVEKAGGTEERPLAVVIDGIQYLPFNATETRGLLEQLGAMRTVHLVTVEQVWASRQGDTHDEES